MDKLEFPFHLAKLKHFLSPWKYKKIKIDKSWRLMLYIEIKNFKLCEQPKIILFYLNIYTYK